MKKIVFLLVFFMLLSMNSGFSQKTFRFGFQSSPTWSYIRTTDKKLEGVSSNWGLRLGAVGEYYFVPERYAFFGGLGFGFNQGGNIQNGYTSASFWTKSALSNELKVLPTNAKLHYRLNYVEVPFGLKMRGGSGEDNPLKFYAEIPTFTIGFVSKAVGDIRGYSSSVTNPDDALDIDIREDVNGLSLAWGLGGGIEYELAANAHLVAAIGYQQQFTDFTGDSGLVSTDGSTPSIEEKSKGTIRMIALRLGIFF